MSARKKLQNADIITIISDYRCGRATQPELAARYGVTQSCISRIVRGNRQRGLGFRLLEAHREAARA